MGKLSALTQIIGDAPRASGTDAAMRRQLQSADRSRQRNYNNSGVFSSKTLAM
jgi:hypothetical protein